MSKDAFYFPHDTNASNDPRVVELIMKHGLLGYGAYWRLIEILHEVGGYYPEDYDRITFVLRCDSTLVRSVVNDFELFKIDGGKITSERVLRNIEKRKEKSEKARKSVSYRYGDTNVVRTQYDRSTKKERKGKESKEKKVSRAFQKPTPDEVTEYAKSISFNLDGNKFCDHYEASGWVRNKTPIKDWRACVRTWKSNGYDNKPAQEEKRLPTPKELGL